MSYQLYTIGYGNRTPEQFKQVIAASGVTDIYDIRRKGKARLRCYDPGSIRKLLGERYYEHIPELSKGEDESFDDYTASLGGDRKKAAAGLADSLFADFQLALNPCLLCAEGKVFDDLKHPRCHRFYLAQFLKSVLEAAGIRVHIRHL